VLDWRRDPWLLPRRHLGRWTGEWQRLHRFLSNGDDSFIATTSIGQFEVHGEGGADVLRGSGAATHSPGFGTPPETFYSADYLYGGAGNDHLYGDFGADFLYGGAGNDVLDGGKKATDDDHASPSGDDTFSGGPGNDLILAADNDRDNQIDCGPGKHDVAVIDKIDPKPIHCEMVKVRWFERAGPRHQVAGCVRVDEPTPWIKQTKQRCDHPRSRPEHSPAIAARVISSRVGWPRQGAQGLTVDPASTSR
jgi:hypothetical protein